MKLSYFSHTNMRAGRVSAIQIMNTCSAFAAAGADVTLFDFFYYTQETDRIKGGYWEHYGLSPLFKRHTFPTLLWPGAARVPGLTAISKLPPLAVYALRTLVRSPYMNGDIVYTRCHTTLATFLTLRRLLSRNRRPLVIFEAHEAPKGLRGKYLRKADGVVCISQALRDRLVTDFEVRPERTIVEHDAVDIDRFAPRPGHSKEALRRRLRLPTDAIIAAYAGGLYKGEMDVLCSTARKLPSNYVIAVAGGTESEVNDLRKHSPDNLLIMGRLPHAEIPMFLQAADVFLMPYTGRLNWSPFFSPVKLFEYHAAQRPVISSDLPVLRELLTSGQNAVLTPPGDSSALAAAITDVIDQPELCADLVRRGREAVEVHTWQKRAERILRFCSELDTM